MPRLGALTSLPNVVMRPQVGPEAVPGVLAGFAAGLMPYADIAMTRYTYPAKLHQYLAADLPIASTPLPDLDEFGDLVEVGAGADEFVAAVERALEAPPRAGRRAVAAQNTWDARYERIWNLLRQAVATTGDRR